MEGRTKGERMSREGEGEKDDWEEEKKREIEMKGRWEGREVEGGMEGRTKGERMRGKERRMIGRKRRRREIEIL